ncbi:hypothetical protein IE81DRAFT_349324 [Ceraceosorus guamensis]|uniref:tRNA (guanine(37)-N1)-methyltransferase n=1 Tax=Ceraceosorus guamensis TaxID=1522189 RepID=A0A316VSK9_9BASI|nr:hypothetical protein IE81DRAFT_349324 [Ceraceosorus guamensis]PWN40350.1 hypothetical protein IE81DRAFT_349324 [Ceraceosorus guamensis]
MSRCSSDLAARAEAEGQAHSTLAASPRCASASASRSTLPSGFERSIHKLHIRPPAPTSLSHVRPTHGDDDDARSDLFAKGQGGAISDEVRRAFERTYTVWALEVLAKDSARIARSESVAAFALREKGIKTIIPCPHTEMATQQEGEKEIQAQQEQRRLVLLSMLVDSDSDPKCDADSSSSRQPEDVPTSSSFSQAPSSHLTSPNQPQSFTKQQMDALHDFVRSTPNVRLTKHELEITYDYWSADQVLATLLPRELPEGTPTAFTAVGHIAHLNLREEYLPYRYIIGQAILDKNNGIRTVVNKLDTIDTQFRFFQMELIAGMEDYIVTATEQSCDFTFDFRTVYWNSRLHSEHARIVGLMKPWEVLCDVMAGVGPFSIPAAKKGVYVLCNDLNPASYESLCANVKRNRVEGQEGKRIRVENVDGRDFVRQSVERLWNEAFEGAPIREKDRRMLLQSPNAAAKAARSARNAAAAAAAAALPSSSSGAQQPSNTDNLATTLDIPRSSPRRMVDHYVLNLPSIALEFLDAFRGAWVGLKRRIGQEEMQRYLDQKEGEGGRRLPRVHVHCFTKDLQRPFEDIVMRANHALGLEDHHRLIAPPNPSPDARRSTTNRSTTDIAATPSQAQLQQHFSASQPIKLETTTQNKATATPTAIATPGLSLHFVRSVAPNKDMYCLSFDLTEQILLDDSHCCSRA